MEEQNKHWRNKIKVFVSIRIQDVEKTLNEFFKNKFVIATQLFPIGDFLDHCCNVIVYYKISPEEQEADK